MNRDYHKFVFIAKFFYLISLLMRLITKLYAYPNSWIYLKDYGCGNYVLILKVKCMQTDIHDTANYDNYSKIKNDHLRMLSEVKSLFQQAIWNLFSFLSIITWKSINENFFYKPSFKNRIDWNSTKISWSVIMKKDKESRRGFRKLY